jgi:hypothetical protein
MSPTEGQCEHGTGQVATVAQIGGMPRHHPRSRRHGGSEALQRSVRGRYATGVEEFDAMNETQRSETVHGVTIVSRHGVARELLRMRKSVESLPAHLREQIVEFFCDSKVGDHYGIFFLRSGESAEAILPFLPPLRASSVVLLAGRERVMEFRGG